MSGMVLPENELEAGIRDALENAAGLTALATQGIWNGAADEGTRCPFVRFFPQDPGQSSYNFGDRRVLFDSQWTVLGVTEGYASMLAGQIDRAIDAALNSSTLVVAGYTVNRCVRVANVSYTEKDQAGEYRHRGGTYAIQLTQ